LAASLINENSGQQAVGTTFKLKVQRTWWVGHWEGWVGEGGEINCDGLG